MEPNRVGCVVTLKWSSAAAPLDHSRSIEGGSELFVNPVTRSFRSSSETQYTPCGLPPSHIAQAYEL